MGGRRGVEATGEGLQGGGLEDGAQGQLHAEGSPHAGDELGGQQRVAARFEEVVLHAHAGQAQHLGPEGGELLLGGRAWGDVLGSGGRGVRDGEGLAVHLAAGRQREGGQHDEGRRHHVLGQLLVQALAQRTDFHRLRATPSHDVRDQTLVAGPVLASHHHRLLHGGLLLQRGLDFTQLDAQAAHLHLEVGPAQVFDFAVRQPARHVAGAVQPRARRVAEGIGDEALRRQLRAAQVAAPHLHAADEQLARHADGHRAQVRVQEANLRVGDGAADGHRAVRLIAHARVIGDVDGGLGGAVEVVQAGGGQPLQAALRQLQWQGLTAAHHALQRRAPLQPRLLQEHLEHGGHEVQGGDALLGDEPREVRGLLVSAGPCHHQSRSCQQRPEELPDGDVEAEGRLLQHRVGWGEAVLLLHPQQAVDDAAVRVHRALGPAGAARGEDDVGQGLRAGERLGAGLRLAGHFQPLRVQAEQPGLMRG